ncbi:glycosyltransferase family 2 protein [Bradyrhizobium erythrophlei]|uniref:glycosyltransferase family 2 protein n=1 Tax=Bradyrhizobium erythrophlei TaxID=1437360 RepID=UPI0035F0E9F6
MNPELSIVVPLYNEEDNIEELYTRLTPVLVDLGKRYELIFVDDGSRDRTFNLLAQLQAKDDKVHVIRLRRNFGQTGALAAGFDFAEGDVIVSMDGDLQHSPEDIPSLLAKLAEGYDVVSGWREKRVDNYLLRRLPSLVANALMARLSRLPLHDFGTTFKAYRREVIKNIELFGELHRFIPALASMQGVAIAEVPIKDTLRKRGSSNYGISRTFHVLFDLLTVKFLIHYVQRPLQFFGLWGLLMSGVGFLLLAGITVLKLFYNVSIYQYLGSLLLGMLLLLLGIQLVAAGLEAELSARIYHTVKGWKIYAVREICSTRHDKVA